MKNIITLTVNPALDTYTTIDCLEPNKKLRCQSPMIDPGGGGVNVARVIHCLGGNSTALYTQGGHTGNIYSDLLDKEGITQDPVEIKGNLRENHCRRPVCYLHAFLNNPSLYGLSGYTRTICRRFRLSLQMIYHP